MVEMKCEPDLFASRIIFMSMYNDMEWGNVNNNIECIFKLQNCGRVCKEILERRFVIPRTRLRNKVVRNAHVQTEWKMGRSR